MKFVITHAITEFDPSDMERSFSILGEFHGLAEAQAFLTESVARLTTEQLENHPGWRLIEERGSYFPVNKDNKIVDSRVFKVGDGTAFHSIYNNLEVIEVPDVAVVDETLFNLETGGYAVTGYFNKLRTKQ
ncbi:MAG TPA: hypothetical protein VOA88_05710 [Candidatus Dormibacteraeota bacterium]|nr:hypothetical protein [Candidatus Dormibacteraeota bacterium]